MAGPGRPTVLVQAGVLQGRSAGGVTASLGVPYAAPPFGERRLQPPQPVPAWDGVREVSAYGPTLCPWLDPFWRPCSPASARLSLRWLHGRLGAPYRAARPS